MSGAGLAFFLSYARDDQRSGPPGNVARFFEDLSRALTPRLKNVGGGEVGFIDSRGIEPGSEWPDSLRTALGSARVFVPVLSPRYFEREYCGKEWAAFRTRVPAGARLIQPVLFVPPVDLNPMPKALKKVQYAHDKYPAEYLEKGLSELLNVPSLEDAYQRFVFAFAGVLAEVLREPAAAAEVDLPPLAEFESAFHDPATGHRDEDPSSPPGRRLYAHFIYVAARHDELAGMRNDLAAYGDLGGLDWQPYLPKFDTEIGILATAVAARERFFYEMGELDDRLVERVKEATTKHKVVVVLVDPWTVRLGHYQRLMRELDEMAAATCVVMIPINENDPETAEQRASLEAVIEATFINRTAAPDPAAFAPWIRSLSELESELAAKLAGAKMRVLRSDAVVRRARTGKLIMSPPSIGASPPAGR